MVSDRCPLGYLFICSSLFLQVTRTTIKSRMGSKFGKIRPGTYIVTTLVLSILNGSSSFLHTIRTTIKAWMGMNFGKIPLLTSELAALEHQKN